ncbi:MAG: hypothetical protein KGK07_07415 [Chloroflexota bacterium]|nr:hypothetical protein [Chloroflexota bacterium]
MNLAMRELRARNLGWVIAQVKKPRGVKQIDFCNRVATIAVPILDRATDGPSMARLAEEALKAVRAALA